MGIEFTAIDFETANGFRGSPCSVGLVKVRDGAIVDEASWLMRPPEGHDFFDRRNVRIHGIEADMVAGAPRFGELFPEIGAFIGSDLLVAHNAAFDMGVIRSALEVSNLPGPAYDYTCSVVHSRRTYSLVSHSLPFAAEAAGVPLRNHHDAVEDSRACAGIMLDIVRRSGAADMAGFFALQGMVPSRLEAYVPGVDTLSKATRAALERGTGSEAKAVATGWAGWPSEGENPPPNPLADPGHPLFGHTVVFSGNLGMSRQSAKNSAADLGARPASNVTRATTMLVMGDGFEAGDLRNGVLTGKARRVLDLHGKGQRIEVLSEAEFLQMIGGTWPASSQ
ncbi:exonuclease [Arthrobacter jiangjiafuii]|uniref:Exonuclease n=1 Tax=Arthrobacter jiangjiafuii TaxID=2817475 RepID=A0A975M396_9MICC|nr:exonuclease domain-containing protein [Arthrobacter jiangjiafuii]MBP3044956.1 exonuclease [Arthrobacter jiangjiafuii]QWC09173.1 exonuclease [Arthrobacter jiangjiafuii]